MLCPAIFKHRGEHLTPIFLKTKALCTDLILCVTLLLKRTSLLSSLVSISFCSILSRIVCVHFFNCCSKFIGRVVWSCVLQKCIPLFVIKTIERNEMYIYRVLTVNILVLRILMILRSILMSSVYSRSPFTFSDSNASATSLSTSFPNRLQSDSPATAN